MHSSACFLELSDSDTVRLLEKNDAQMLHGVACPVGGLRHRGHSEAFTKFLESKVSLRGASPRAAPCGPELKPLLSCGNWPLSAARLRAAALNCQKCHSAGVSLTFINPAIEPARLQLGNGFLQ
jgi:hypothetical protein